MDYLLLFLEGIITFISPCLLPMIPIYISYLAGQGNEGNRKSAVVNSIGFVSGFTTVFVLLGAFAGTAGSFLRNYSTAINIVCGIVVILFGLNFLGVVRIPFINANRQVEMKEFKAGFVSSVLFGIIFSISWTPCVGTFLGSALMLAATSRNVPKAIIMLLFYSAGLGIPFVLSAVLIDRLKAAFDFVKRNYHVINSISGGILVIVGILMATGYMGYFLSLLSY